MNPRLRQSLLWLLGAVVVAALFGAAAVTWWGTHALGPEPGALAVLAAYAPSGTDLRPAGITALTQVGTLDTLVNRDNLDAGLKLLRSSAVYDRLQGGNHAQFGEYGPQPGDDPNPTMSAAEQRRKAVDGTVSVLREAAAK